MPDGRPCPAILTADEVVELLRFTGRGQLDYYRERRLIRGSRIGRHVRYTIDEVKRFVKEQED